MSSVMLIMEDLAEQADKNISELVRKAELPGAIEITKWEDVEEDEYGKAHHVPCLYYSYGPCSSSSSAEEVILEYKNLISNIYRRTAFLSIYSFFEHILNRLYEELVDITGYKSTGRLGVFDKINCALNLKKIYINQFHVKELSFIRNSLAHNDGDLKKVVRAIERSEKPSHQELASYEAVKSLSSKCMGVSLSTTHRIYLKDNFLECSIKEISCYFKELKLAFELLGYR